MMSSDDIEGSRRGVMALLSRRGGLSVGIIILLGLTFAFLSEAFTRVQPGYVGIRVNNIGPSAGVVSAP
ncbi:hypothetical protein, partial [Salmonella enterica]|uniref:hypothetical protein n=1 Tax=Salmonella enterica TaxID=28901 RepID=UPI003D2BDF33